MFSRSRQTNARAENAVEEMVSLLSRSEQGRDEGDFVGQQDCEEVTSARRSSLGACTTATHPKTWIVDVMPPAPESEATATVPSEISSGKTAKQGSPLKAVRLAVDDVVACRGCLEKLESDLLHASERYDNLSRVIHDSLCTVFSLQFNSLDLSGYKRNLMFVETLTPIVTKANIHAGSASRISSDLMKSLENYATAVKPHGSSQSEIESIGPLVTSLSQYMSQVEEAVNEAIAFVERPDVSIEEIRNKAKRICIIFGAAFVGLFVLFMVDTMRLSSKMTSGFPTTLIVIFCSLPFSIIAFLVMMIRSE